jgi:DnaK suppressor protein
MGTRAITITTAQLKRRKRSLESKLKELLVGSHERENLRIEYLADPLDRVRSNADREVAVQRLDHQTRWIHDIQSALAKMKEGNYGVCERCEGPIPLKRLDTVPWAGLCVRCQSAAEDAGGREEFKHAA